MIVPLAAHTDDYVFSTLPKGFLTDAGALVRTSLAASGEKGGLYEPLLGTPVTTLKSGH